MFNNHSMSLVLDLNMIANEIRNVDLFTIAAITTSEVPNSPNVFYAGILVPPTELLMNWADGDQLAIHNRYPYYLQSQECDEIIITFLAALTKKNVIWYIPGTEYEIFGDVFINYLYYTYGIILNTPTTQFSIDQHRIPLIISKFYMLNFMDPEVYIDMYPWQYQYPDFVINKLAYDFKPFNRPATFEEYKAYFNQMNASRAPSGRVLMTQPVYKPKG